MKAEDAAMIVAAYADCRAYRSEAMGIVRITCELPVEYEAEVHRRLGYPGKGKALILSLANPDQVKAYGPPPDAKAAPEKPKRKWEELSAREQAVLRCKDAQFINWLRLERYVPARMGHMTNEEVAAYVICRECEVESRSQLDGNAIARETWQRMNNQYQAYLTEQRHADNLSRG